MEHVIDAGKRPASAPDVVTDVRPATVELLGTSHVSRRSEAEVRDAVPLVDIVAIELDAGRAEGLLTGRQATFAEMRQALGVRAALVAYVLRGIQRRLAGTLDLEPGVEMKAALLAARDHGKTVVLIDRDIRITMRRLAASIGWREVRTMLADMFRRTKIAIHPDQDMVVALLAEVKVRYPRIYAAMVAERDEYMTRALLAVAAQYPGARIVAVVGMGHVPGMLEHATHLNSPVRFTTWNSTATRSGQSSPSAQPLGSSSP